MFLFCLDIDQPLSVDKSSVHNSSPSDIAQLMDMGFSEKQAQKALKETSQNVERAVDWLFNHPEETGEDMTQEPMSTQGKINLFFLKKRLKIL